jgi:type IV pilus assembly protein PilN
VIRINLLPVREARRQARQIRQGLYLGSAAGIGVLLCVVLQIWMAQQIRSHRALLVAKEAELKRLEETQKEVKQFEQEKADIEAKLAVIQEIEKARSGPVRLMDTVATQIPKRVWLTELSAREGKLEMQGRSLDAEIVAEFLTSLENSEMIENVELQETQLRELEGLKLNTFKLKGEYPYPKLGALGLPDKAAKGKKAKGQKKAGVAHGDG